MEIVAKRSVTYLYVNGISITRPIDLGPNVQLLPASCNPTPDQIVASAKSETDIGVAAIFLRHIQSQLRISGENPKAVAVNAWNAAWDIILLSALFKCDAVCNLQSNDPAEKLNAGSELSVTNYHFRGLGDETGQIDEPGVAWINRHFQSARLLLGNHAYETAVYSLATYRWHTHPRLRMAIIWAGIESLFGIESELSFRISLYAARFLAPDDPSERRRIFASTKRLYGSRSKAVHGSKISSSIRRDLDDSINLLWLLVRKCAEVSTVPEAETLAP